VIKKVGLVTFLSLMAISAELKTHSEFSYIQTTGNTDTKSLGLDFRGQKDWDIHKLALDLDAYYAENDGEETKNNIRSELNYFRPLSSTIDFNYLVGYKDDKFSGYDYQFYTGPGVKFNVFKTPVQTLYLSGNVLYSLDDYDEGDEEDYFSGRAGLDYIYKFNENVKFVEEANIRSRFDDADTWFLYSKSSIYSKISDNLSLGLSYKVNHQNNPPANRKETDTTTMVSLVVDW